MSSAQAHRSFMTFDLIREGPFIALPKSTAKKHAKFEVNEKENKRLKEVRKRECEKVSTNLSPGVGCL